MTLSRDIELRVQGHLREIGQTNDAVISSRQGLPPAMKGYERSLRSVAECATASEVDKVAEYIKSKIRENGRRPPNREVRRSARMMMSESGYAADEFLNKA